MVILRTARTAQGFNPRQIDFCLLERATLDQRWKLIRYPLVDRTQLFDLQADPQEMKNLADLPEHAGHVHELLVRLELQQKAFGDPAPLEVANPQPADWSPKPQSKRKKG